MVQKRLPVLFFSVYWDLAEVSWGLCFIVVASDKGHWKQSRAHVSCFVSKQGLFSDVFYIPLPNEELCWIKHCLYYSCWSLHHYTHRLQYSIWQGLIKSGWASPLGENPAVNRVSLDCQFELFLNGPALRVSSSTATLMFSLHINFWQVHQLSSRKWGKFLPYSIHTYNCNTL